MSRTKRVVTAVTMAASLALAAPARPETPPRGVEPTDIDRAVDPCDDFYAFANGAWRAAHPIPAGSQRTSRRLVTRAENRRQLTALLQELSARTDRPRGSVEQQLGDHFASCMDERAIDGAGLTPLAPLLAEIAGVRDRAGVERAIRRLHELAVPVAFVVTSASDYNDPTLLTVNIAAGALGLGDRDAYLKPDGPSAQAREKYRDHVARVLALGGMDAVATGRAAADVLALETRLAADRLAGAAAADPATTAHRVAFAKLASARFEWERYFIEAGLPRADVNVTEPAFLARLDAELDATPVVTWKAYLTWHLIESASPWLSKPFADEWSAFTGKSPDRAALCLESTETLLGEPLGRAYAARVFPPAAKIRVQEMAAEILGVLREDVSELTWMAPATRAQALAKLASYDVKVGYPDTWMDVSALAIRRDAFWANVAAARRFGVDADRRRAGQRTSRSLWALPPSSPDAYIDVQLNLMALPAGFLQPPAFDLAASDAVNYGAIGIGMAHDLTHALDTLGADFDAAGLPAKWWTEADRRAFEKAGQCVVDQYGAYAIEPGVTLDGKRVLGEAIGDAAGVRLAYRALQRSMKRRPVPTIDGFTPEQQFFIAWGQYRGAAESLELQREMRTSDPHAVSKYRVIGPLSDAPEFQQAFACKAGSPMTRPPERRCAVWREGSD